MILNIRKNATKGFLWGSLYKILALVFPFVIRTIIIRTIGSEYSGLNSLFTSILQVLSLAELGFGTALVYSMYEPIAHDDTQRICAILKFYRDVYLRIGAVIFLLGLSVMPLLRFLVSGDVPSDVNLYVLFAIYLFNTVLSYFFFGYKSSLFAAYQRQDIISIIAIACQLTGYVLQILILLLFKNYYAYIIIIPVVTVLINSLTAIVSNRKFSQIVPNGNLSREEKQEIKKNIKALFFHKVGAVVVHSADNIVISSFLGLVILSNYNNYYYLLNAVSGFIMIFFTSLTAGIGNSLVINRDDKRDRFYDLFYLNGLVVSLCTVCFFSLYQDFIEVWVGKENQFSFSIMVLFCLYFFIHMIRRTVIMYRDASGMWTDNKFQPIVSAAINLTLNLVLVNYIGVYGIIISTIVSMVFVDIPWESGKVTKKLFNEAPLKYYLKMVLFLAISAVSCGCIYLLNRTLIVGIYLKLVLELLFAIAVSTLSFFLLTLWMPECRRVAKSVKDNVIKKKEKKADTAFDSDK